MVKKKEKELAIEPTFNIGDNVRHKLLGEGIITDVRFNGIVVVQFKTRLQKMCIRFLTKLDKKNDK